MNALIRRYLDDIAVLMTEEYEADDPRQISRLLITSLSRSRRVSAILEKLLEDIPLVAGNR